jgi:TolA-binding protein
VAGVFVTTKVIIPNHNYNSAVALMESGDYDAAITAFKELDGYKDSGNLIDYSTALNYMESGKYSKAIKQFESLGDYSDAQEKIVECQNLENESNYQTALDYMESGKYSEAIKQFESLGDYSDAQEKIEECQELEIEANYQAAIGLMDSGKYLDAIDQFESLGDYSDSQQKIEECQNLLNQEKYQEATGLYNQGDYKEAYQIYSELGTYLDSESKSAEAQAQYLSTAKVGDVITFGSYEQDDDATDGKEAIEWIVLEKQDNQIFVISQYVLDAQAFNSSKEKIDWENSTLRTWLNETFYNKAFSSTEQKKIVEGIVSNEPGDTTDKIFLMSSRELKNYFSTTESFRCKATAYAIYQGASVDTSGGQYDGDCRWMLRPSGFAYENYAYVGAGEKEMGRYIYAPVNAIAGIRPAMWISTEG